MLITIAAIRIPLIQMNSRTAARDENVERACGFVATAAADGAELAVLPEMFHGEFFPQYRYYRYMDAEPDTGCPLHLLEVWEGNHPPGRSCRVSRVTITPAQLR